MHHAFVIEAETEKGITRAEEWAKEEFGIDSKNNPDFVVLRYGLLSAEDARTIAEHIVSAPLSHKQKIVVIAASRIYHEAQNALLKLFEEPPQGTYLFLILPVLGSVLSTLRSRVMVLEGREKTKTEITEIAERFLKATKEKRSAFIKKLSSGKDEEERRLNRDEAVAILNGIEQAAHKKFGTAASPILVALLSDIATLRIYLFDRSAPVRLILEHLSLVIPKGLL